MRDAQFALHAEIEDRHWWFLGRRAIVKQLLERVVTPRLDALVIDVGCGTGANIAAMSKSYRCMGVDESAQAIELAKSRFVGVEYACEANVYAKADQLGTASAVLLMDVLEHVQDEFAMLSQLLSLLRPGTHVLITVPADPSLWTIHDESFGHWRRYDVERLRETWRGLAVEERLLSPYNARLFSIIKAVRTLSKRRGRPAGKAGTDFSMPPRVINRWLADLFSGEATALERAIDGTRPPYARGASLIAILRRTEGAIVPRNKPEGVRPDRRSGSN